MKLYLFPSVCGDVVVVRAENAMTAFRILADEYTRATAVGEPLELEVTGPAGIVTSFLG